MSNISTLGKALIVVFTVLILAILFDLLYVIWRRHLFLRRDPTETTRPDHDQPEINAKSTYNSKHDLLYFFCLKSTALSRVEPAENPRVGAPNGSDDPVEVFDVVKLREMYGSRVLFTIKDEEKEDLESLSWLTNKARRTRNSTESFGDTALVPEFLVTINDEEVNDEEVINDHEEEVNDVEVTPFSTPCASPLYFTPAGSPIHEMLQRNNEVAMNRDSMLL